MQQLVARHNQFLTSQHSADLTIVLPPPDEQRAIAGVLGALDDKIEQNRQTAWAPGTAHAGYLPGVVRGL